MANRDIRAMSCPPSGSTNGAGPLPPGVNMTKAKVKRKKNDWSWEDEMLMYDVTQRDAAKKKRRMEKEEGSDETKKLKKQKEDEQLYQKEERKLFLGGLSQDTVEKDLRKHFIQFGEIIDVQVMREKTGESAGKSRGFGFVTFSCSFMAEAALDCKEHVIKQMQHLN